MKVITTENGNAEALSIQSFTADKTPYAVTVQRLIPLHLVTRNVLT